MTIVDVVLAVGRQWLLALIGLLVTGVLGFAASRGESVYWSQTDVRFIAVGPRFSNPLVSTSASVIATAGLIALETNPRNGGPRLSTDEVSIVDAGIHDGVLVRLPNNGGQWATNFNEPSLNVQVSGPDPEQVRQRTMQVVADITERLAAHQDAYSVAAGNRILVNPTPPVPVVAVAHRSPMLATAATVVLGSGLTLGAALYVDQLRARRRVVRAGRR